MGLTVLLSVIVIVREPRRRRPLRDPRSPHPGGANAEAWSHASTRRRTSRGSPSPDPAGISAGGRCTDPSVEPLEGRVAPLRPQPGARRRGGRLRAPAPLLRHRAVRLALRPQQARLLARQDETRAEAPVLGHRQVRTRPLHAHGARRPRLDPDRLRRDARDPRDRRRLRRDLGVRRRPARQRDDALPRRALRAALPALRDHHARDHRHGQLLDDDDRALDRELVHDGAHRSRPDHHAEGERLRARGERGRRALVPDPLAAPAAEHARRADHRDLPRAARA